MCGKLSAYFLAVMKIFDVISKLVSDKVNSQCYYSQKLIMEIVYENLCFTTGTTR